MKKVLTIQAIVILLTATAGLFLKSDLGSDVRVAHRLLGTLAGLVGLGTIIMAFVSQKNTTLRVLSVVAFLLLGSAAMGGMELAASSNYNVSFGQMTLSGVAALIVTGVMHGRMKKGK